MPTVKQQTPPPKAVIKTASPKSVDPNASVIDRIEDLLPDAGGIKLAVYGVSGSGKTTFWSSFPGKILCILCSGGFKPGELKSINTPEMRKRIKQVSLKFSHELAALADHVRANNIYDLVVIDHVSGVQDLTLKEILNLEQIPVQRTFGMATQQDYGQSTIMCKELFREFLNLDTNVVFVGQERVFNGRDEIGMEGIIRPTVGIALTPQLTGWLNPACDYVVQCFKRPKMEVVYHDVAGEKMAAYQRGKGVEYCLRTEPHDVFTTKFRMPKGRALPEVIVDPTYDKVMAIINGEYEEGS